MLIRVPASARHSYPQRRLQARCASSMAMLKRHTSWVSCAFMLVAGGALVLGAQTSVGHEYVLRVEAQVQSPALGVMSRLLLPDGIAEMRVITDGQWSRTELKGGIGSIPSGAVILDHADQSEDFVVLLPAERAYYRYASARSPSADKVKRDIKVSETGVFETIIGHRTEKVAVTWHVPATFPNGLQPPPGFPSEVSVEVEQWCARDVALGSTTAQAFASLNRVLGAFVRPAPAQACAFPLRVKIGGSASGGFYIVTSVVSIENASTSPELFKTPAEYREIAAPPVKIPRMN